MTRPDLSIILVLHNSREGLEACLRSIGPAVESGSAELIAVDNATPDDSVAIVRAALPQARLLAEPVNLGFAGGANRAMREAAGRYWLLLNPDVAVEPGGLGTLVQWMDAHPAIGVASPEIRGAEGGRETPGRAAPTAWRLVFETSRLHRLLPPQLRGRMLRGAYWRGGDQVDVAWVPGTAMIVRPEAARTVGLLREELFMYGEDIEWCWRMRRSGWRVGVCAATTFTHGPSTSAVRTFGTEASLARMVAGTAAAHRLLMGPLRARAIAGATAVSLGIEAIAPGRSPSQRARARALAGLWLGIARSPPGPPGSPQPADSGAVR